MSTRQTLLLSLGILLLVALGAWWYLGFTLDFARFFAAEPGVTDTTGGTTSTVDTSAGRTGPVGCQTIGAALVCEKVACIALQRSVTVGSPVTVQAYGGTGGYVFTAPGGSLAVAQSGTNAGTDTTSVRYDSPGTKQVLVSAKRASDPTQTDIATCSVTVIPAAVTN